MTMRAVWMLLSALALSAGAADAQIRPQRMPGFQTVEPVPTDVEADIIDRTNAFRAEQGLGSLSESAVLTQEARDFAGYLARTGGLSHEADGRSPADRARAAGYDYCELAENLAFEDGVSFFHSDPAADLMRGWEASPSHRRNLLDPAYVDIGVGVAQASNGRTRYVAVQVFGRPTRLRFAFKVTNRTGSRVHYSYEGGVHAIDPEESITYRPCAPEIVAFQTKGPAGRAPYEVEPDALYVLLSDDRGGVKVEIKRRDAL